MLVEAGITVSTAPTAWVALEMLEKDEFDLMVTDLALPEGLMVSWVSNLKRANRASSPQPPRYWHRFQMARIARSAACANRRPRRRSSQINWGELDYLAWRQRRTCSFHHKGGSFPPALRSAIAALSAWSWHRRVLPVHWEASPSRTPAVGWYIRRRQ